MGIPRGLGGLALIDAIDHAHVGSTFDESPDADRDIGFAIFAAHQQMGPAVARGKRRRDQRAVVERGFFIGDQPSRAPFFRAPLFVVRLGAGRIGRGCINSVVAFQSLAIVLDLTAELERFLSVRTCSKQEAGAYDDERGAHFREQAGRIRPAH